MKTIQLAIATLGILAAMPASAEEQRIKVGVGELTCPTCSFTVAAAMRGVPTVEIIDFQDGEEFGTGTYVVAFDDQATSPDMIIEAVQSNGYPAEVLQAGDS
ncbi:MAG: periplasmic mercury ion-binding protein [Silicimonas sp.]|uniref:periplasmic mercury ion-binding protein n=1 Tax=Sulfitobacter litoralis TaxID=335975 RepID=UPI0017DC5E4B|nr:periplasmic mercury ion-binding protein [Sulfitobacter litoralis]NND20200.1 periplasmic mercury ion-binding protein [Silicimonas sp.]